MADVEGVRMMTGNENSVSGGLPGGGGREGSGAVQFSLTALKEAADMFNVNKGGAFSQQYGGIKPTLEPIFSGLRDSSTEVVMLALDALLSVLSVAGPEVSPQATRLVTALVEAPLGDSRSSTRDKGVDVLFRLISSSALSAPSLLKALHPSLRNRNIKLRQQIAAFLTTLSDAPTSTAESSSLRVPLTECLSVLVSDANGDVRQGAMEGLSRLMARHGQQPVIKQLEELGVRRAQIRLLTTACNQGQGSDGQNQCSTGPVGRPDRGPRLPGSRATGETAEKGLHASSASVSSSSSAHGTGTQPGGIRKAGKNEKEGVVLEHVEAQVDVCPLRVASPHDLATQMEHVTLGLQASEDQWQARVEGLQRLQQLAVGGAGQLDSFVPSIRAINELVATQVSSLRSALSKEGCTTVSVLAQALGDAFAPLSEIWTPVVLRMTVTGVLTISLSADQCLRCMVCCTKVGFGRMLPLLIGGASDKTDTLRQRSVIAVTLALFLWDPAVLDKHLDALAHMIKTAIADKKEPVRAAARQCFWVLHWKFPAQAEALLDVLDSEAPRSRKLLERDKDSVTPKAIASLVPSTRYRIAGEASRPGLPFAPSSPPPSLPLAPPAPLPPSLPTPAAAPEPPSFTQPPPQSSLPGPSRPAPGRRQSLMSSSGPVRIMAPSRTHDPPSSHPTATPLAPRLVPPPTGANVPPPVPPRAVRVALSQAPPPASQRPASPDRPSLFPPPPPAPSSSAGPSSLSLPSRMAGPQRVVRPQPHPSPAHATPQPALRVRGLDDSLDEDTASLTAPPTRRAPPTAPPTDAPLPSKAAAPSDPKPPSASSTMSNMGMGGWDVLLRDAESPTWATRVRCFEELSCRIREFVGHAPASSSSSLSCTADESPSPSFPASRVALTLLKHLNDNNAKVTQAALEALHSLLLSRPHSLLPHLDPLLPHLLTKLSDPKEALRSLAQSLLDACRAAFDPSALLASLARTLHEHPDRTKTAALEFLPCLLPHPSSASHLTSQPAAYRTLLTKLAALLTTTSQRPGASNLHLQRAAGGGVASLYHVDPALFWDHHAALGGEAQGALRKALLPLVPNLDARTPTQTQSVRGSKAAASSRPSAPLRAPPSASASGNGLSGSGSGLDKSTDSTASHDYYTTQQHEMAAAGSIAIEEHKDFMATPPPHPLPLPTWLPQHYPTPTMTQIKLQGGSAWRRPPHDPDKLLPLSMTTLADPHTTPHDRAEAVRALAVCLSSLPAPLWDQYLGQVVHLLLEEMRGSGLRPPSSSTSTSDLHASPLFRVISPASRHVASSSYEQEGVEEDMGHMGGTQDQDPPLPRESMVTNTRFMAIQSLRMLMKARPSALCSHVNVIMGRLLDCATDAVYEVFSYAERALHQLIHCTHPDHVFQCLCEFMCDDRAREPRVLMCLRGLSAYISRGVSSPTLLASLPTLAPLLTRHVAHSNTLMRMTAVQCLCEVYQVIGDSLHPHLQSLTRPQHKLLTLWIQRARADRSGSSSTAKPTPRSTTSNSTTDRSASARLLRA